MRKPTKAKSKLIEFKSKPKLSTCIDGYVPF